MKNTNRRRTTSQLTSTLNFTLTLILLSMAVVACNEPKPAEGKADKAQPMAAKAEGYDNFKGELISCTKADIKNAPFYRRMKKRGPSSMEDFFLDEIEVYEIKYKSDGLNVTGFLTVPIGDGPWPCLIFNHAFFAKRKDINLSSAAQVMGVFASKGYAVFASNYRGFGGSEGTYEYGGADIQDVINLLTAAGELPGVDTSSVGLIGLQRGGLINLITLKHSNKFDCVVNINGVVSAKAMLDEIPKLEERFSEQIPGFETQPKEALRLRTPLEWVSDMDKAPILFVHRQDDSLSRMEDVEQLCDALSEKGHPYHLISIKGKKQMQAHREDVFQHCFDWLDTYLKNSGSFKLEGNTTVIEE